MSCIDFREVEERLDSEISPYGALTLKDHDKYKVSLLSSLFFSSPSSLSLLLALYDDHHLFIIIVTT